jgi:hypothetical protein
MAGKLLMYGIGRNAQDYDQPAIRAIVKESARNNYTFPLWFWAWSRAFRSRCGRHKRRPRQKRRSANFRVRQPPTIRGLCGLVRRRTTWVESFLYSNYSAPAAGGWGASTMSDL